jgi:hypothetical protein
MPRRKAEQPSTAALHNPVMAGPKELQYDPSMTPQRGPIDMEHALENPADPLVAIDPEAIKAAASRDYLDQLAFSEQGVTVVIPKSGERNSPNFVYCAVNGKGAEVWDERTKRWLEFTWLPVNSVITVKRKYLEVLGRARVDTYTTHQTTPTPEPNQDAFRLEANTVPAAPFTVRHDPAGERGIDWFNRTMREH